MGDVRHHFVEHATDMIHSYQLLKYKPQILNLLTLLVDKTKGERGYTSTGRLISRVLHTVAGVYPLNSRFMNTDEWVDPSALYFDPTLA